MAKTGFDCPKCGAGILECSQGKCVRCEQTISAGESLSLTLTAALRPIQEESNKKFERACNEILTSVDNIAEVGKKFGADVVKIHEESHKRLAENLRTSLRERLNRPTLWAIIKKKCSAVFSSF
ncbi:MAG: hypothetical protein WCG07_03445 [Candidatus Taylorbacteria bacterium]